MLSIVKSFRKYKLLHTQVLDRGVFVYQPTHSLSRTLEVITSHCLILTLFIPIFVHIEQDSYFLIFISPRIKYLIFKY